MRRLVIAAVALLMLPGCRFDITGLDDTSAIDAPIGPLVDGPPGGPDAPVTADGPLPPAPDAFVPGAPDADLGDCPLECTSCGNDGTCTIDCGSGECGGGVTCPPGRPCIVNCIGGTACETGLVDCTLATSCDITCSGADACDAGVICDGAACTVVCEGSAACEDGGVDCNADVCDLTCDGASACMAHACCNGDTCTSCNSSMGGCCDCAGC